MNDSPIWKQQTEEVVRNLSNLIQAETTNPPGCELPAILLIKDILEKDGFSSYTYNILEPAPNRANLVVRLRGDGSRRPLLLTGHVDVVPVEPERWSHDPFGGEIAEGCVWGRGALDMKGFVAMFLQIFLLVKRQGLPLKRDLIFAAIADEEAGFTYGSQYLVDQHRDLIDAEYALNEGGAMTIPMAGRRIYPIQVAEKGVCWLKMIVSGRPGHGSMPHDDNAVAHLAQALDRLRRAGHLPVHITPTVNAMLKALGAQMGGAAGSAVKLLRNPALASHLIPALPPATRELLMPMLCNSVSPTVLRAGQKTNVIPSSAEAELDCRILPGQTPESAMAEILAITGDKVQLEPINTSTGNESPVDSPFYRLLENATRRMDPSGLVIPMLMPGATDAAEYKRAGIQVYGFTPLVLPDGFELTKLAHGHDERLPISAIEAGLPALWEVVREACL